jgi:hypothetical protein
MEVYSMYYPIYTVYGGGARSYHFGAAGVHRHRRRGDSEREGACMQFLKKGDISRMIYHAHLSMRVLDISRLISHERQVIYQNPTKACGGTKQNELVT